MNTLIGTSDAFAHDVNLGKSILVDASMSDDSLSFAQICSNFSRNNLLTCL